MGFDKNRWLSDKYLRIWREFTIIHIPASDLPEAEDVIICTDMTIQCYCINLLATTEETIAVPSVDSTEVGLVSNSQIEGDPSQM